MSARQFASSLSLGSFIACQVHDFDYSDKPCPCPEPEWVCQTETQRCVKSAAASTTTGTCGLLSTGTSELGRDTFDRSDERPLSGCGLWVGGYYWRAPIVAETTPFDLVSGSIRGTSTKIDNVMAFSVPTPANHYIEVLLAQLGTPETNRAPGALVRLRPAPVFSGYECRVTGLGSRIAKWNDGIYQNLMSDPAVTWQSGDTLRCEVEGTQIRMLRLRGGETTLAVTADDADHLEGSTGLISLTKGELSDAILDEVRVGFIPP